MSAQTHEIVINLNILNEIMQVKYLACSNHSKHLSAYHCDRGIHFPQCWGANERFKKRLGTLG
jgi:hypothetical protein